MENARPHDQAGTSAKNRGHSNTVCQFQGTHNPRELRTLSALMDGPIFRERLDRIAGASNAPDIILRLRRAGLEIPCKRVEVTDRDGKTSRPGQYSLTIADLQAVIAWLQQERMV